MLTSAGSWASKSSYSMEYCEDFTIFIKKSGARSGAQVFYNTFTIKSETQITKLAFFFEIKSIRCKVLNWSN